MSPRNGRILAEGGAPMTYGSRASCGGSPWMRFGFSLALFSGLSSFFPAAAWEYPAWAASNQPVTWSDMSSLDLKPVLRSDYASPENLLEPVINPGAFEVALRDADSLISPEFEVPAALRPAVEFWLRIYTVYSTEDVVLFDSHHPEIVYDVLDFRQLSKTARNRVVYEVVRRLRVKKAVRAYREALLSLARRSRRRRELQPANGFEAKILAALKSAHRRRPFAELAGRIRTQTGQRDNIIKGLLAAEAYFPKMEQVFMAIGIPVELTRLSLVESSFNLSANSRVGAAGVWQFMPGPGRKLMMINYRAGVDERRSPLKATIAAGKLLKENYQRFKSWPLAVTSYNHGLRGLTRFRGGRGADFDGIARLFDPDKRSPLHWAGRNYYAEFLAVLHAEAYRSLFYGVPPVQSMGSVAYQRIQRPETGIALAEEHKVSLQTFKMHNPDIQNLGRRLPTGFWVALPGETDDFTGLLRNHRLRRARRRAPFERRLAHR